MPKDFLEPQEPKVYKALQELLVLKDCKGQLVLQEPKGPPDWQGLLGLTAPMEPTEYRPTKLG